MPAGLDALFRLSVTYLVAGQNCVLTFWIRSKPNDPLPDVFKVCDQIVLDFEIGVMGRLKQVQTTTTQCIAAVATCMNPRLTAQTVRAYTTEFGFVAGDTLPPHDAAVLSLYTRYSGRRTHGRLYIPGIPESMQNEGTLTASAKTAMKNLGDWLVGQWGWDSTTPYYWWGVYSRKNGMTRDPGPPPFMNHSPLALIPWSRHVVNERIGTNRHRKLGRGY